QVDTLLEAFMACGSGRRTQSHSRLEFSHLQLLILPIIVSPPRTRIPFLTTISTCDGIKRSVRDPNFIIPKRSPHSTLSPRRFQQTIRRASTPAICVHVTTI